MACCEMGNDQKRKQLGLCAKVESEIKCHLEKLSYDSL